MIEPPAYVTKAEALALHDQAIGRYGGLGGVRDEGLLESSLAQPQMCVFGVERFPSLAEKAAAYCYFLTKNHAFVDGNKRTAFLTALHFLLKNGELPHFQEDKIYEVITGVACGSVDLTELVAVFREALAR